jgi:TRAP-type mannitol/chloroaromatic compound transport system permease small subunit
MTDAATPRRTVFVTLAGAILVLGAIVAIVVWDPVGSLVRGIDLPEWVSMSALPDLPGWLLWALGKVKFALIALVVLVAVARDVRRKRGA